MIPERRAKFTVLRDEGYDEAELKQDLPFPALRLVSPPRDQPPL